MIKITQIKPREGRAPLELALVTGKTYIVGRKNRDISFEDDQSVSRDHAEILVDHPFANVTNETLIPTLCVTDIGSKFGTWVNQSKIPLTLREPSMLNHDDRFKFGSQWNEFKVEYTPMVVTTSTLENVVELKDILHKLGGHLVGEWKSQCDFVVMDKVSLTIKVVCALLSAKQIVTTAYFKDYLSAVEAKKSSRPKPKNYFPPIAESHLTSASISFEPNLRRTTLFRGKLFLFETTKAIKKMGITVKCGGGETALITSVTPERLKDKNTIMVGIAANLVRIDEKFKTAIEIYESTGKRLIKESEIGMAGLYVSLEHQCNPFVDSSKAYKNVRLGSQTQVQSDSLPSSAVICPETQTQREQSQHVFHTQSQSNRSIINETIVEPRPMSSTSAAKPMEFHVPTVRIKEEQPEPELDRRARRLASSQANKRAAGNIIELDLEDDDGPCPSTSGSKRRLESVTPPQLRTKRHRQTTPDQPMAPSPSTQRSNVSIFQDQNKKNKTLHAMLGLSDDDDDDEPIIPSTNTQVSVVPDSQPPEPVPEPEPERRITRTRAQAHKQDLGRSVVHAKGSNKVVSTVQETQLSVVAEDIIPASPELLEDSDDPDPTPAPFSRKKNAKAGVPDSSAKRKEPEPEPEVPHDFQQPGTSTKKRRVGESIPELKEDPVAADPPNVTNKVENENVDKYFWAGKDEVIREDDIKPLSFVFAKLLLSKPQRPVVPAVEVIDGRTVKNFKRFRKSLPLGQNDSFQNMSSMNTNNTNTTMRSEKTFSFRPFRGPKCSEVVLPTTIEEEVTRTLQKQQRQQPQRQVIDDDSSIKPGPAEIAAPAPAEEMDVEEVEEVEDEFSFFEQTKANARAATANRRGRPARSSPTKSPTKSPPTPPPTRSTRVTRSSPVKPVVQPAPRARVTRSSPTKATRQASTRSAAASSSRSAPTVSDDAESVDSVATTRSTRTTRGRAKAAAPVAVKLPRVLSVNISDEEDAEPDDEWSFK